MYNITCEDEKWRSNILWYKKIFCDVTLACEYQQKKLFCDVTLACEDRTEKLLSNIACEDEKWFLGELKNRL